MLRKKCFLEYWNISVIIFLCVIFYRYDEPQVILSGSDSDDDVQFIEATYEPLLVNNKSAKQKPESVQPATPLLSSPQLVSQPVPCRVVPHSPVLARHTPVIAGQSPLIAGRSPLIAGQSPLIAGQSPLIAGQSPLIAGRSPLIAGQSPLIAGQSPLIAGQSPLISPR